MRSQSTISLIKKNESAPKVYKNFFSSEELEGLLDLYSKLPLTVHNKKQNVKKKRWIENFDKKIETNFINKLKSVIGDFQMDNLKENNQDSIGLFQESFGPIGIHADTGFNLADLIYKQTLVPFDNNGQTIIFKNRFYGYATNFTNDEKEILEFKDIQSEGKNRRSNIHLDLYGNKPFDKPIHEKYLKHINYENLKGLEIELIYQWNKGDLVVFDRSHIHSASSNIDKFKIGLATFTKK